jgi:hypothetical protein
MDRALPLILARMLLLEEKRPLKGAARPGDRTRKVRPVRSEHARVNHLGGTYRYLGGEAAALLGKGK